MIPVCPLLLKEHTDYLLSAHPDHKHNACVRGKLAEDEHLLQWQ